MFNNLAILKMAHALASHSSARQTVIATNVANADTPGFKAKDVVAFDQAYRSDRTSSATKVSRENHISFSGTSPILLKQFEDSDALSPNGNSVSLETEMVKSAEVRQQHDLALSIYSSSLNIIRTSLGRGR